MGITFTRIITGQGFELLQDNIIIKAAQLDKGYNPLKKYEQPYIHVSLLTSKYEQ